MRDFKHISMYIYIYIYMYVCTYAYTFKISVVSTLHSWGEHDVFWFPVGAKKTLTQLMCVDPMLAPHTPPLQSCPSSELCARCEKNAHFCHGGLPHHRSTLKWGVGGVSLNHSTVLWMSVFFALTGTRFSHVQENLGLTSQLCARCVSLHHQR